MNNNNKKNIIFVILLILILLIPVFSDLFFNESVFEQVFISRVIDGDTIEINTGEKIRLIGINTPEKGQNCYLEAKEKLSGFVLNKTILIEKDKENTDRYSRLLRYIYSLDKETFINVEMVRQGYALYYPYGKNLKHKSKLEKAEDFAKENSVGCLWKDYELSPAKNCIKIIDFHYDAQGNDNENLNNEYIVFENACEFNIEMNKYTISDSANKLYKFEEFVFGKNSIFVFYSGKGENNNSAIFWGKSSAVWNNDRDILYLRDNSGNLVLVESY